MFQKMWGTHAGWAHGVVFAADLKSLAAYGSVPMGSLSPLAPSRTVSLPKKARRTERRISNSSTSSASGELHADETVHGDTLAERIKLRRRYSRLNP